MPEIEVDLATLESGQAGVQQVFTRLQGTLDQLDSDLKPMIDSWSGAAQESDLACHRHWTEAAQSLAVVLNSVDRALGAAHENYSAPIRRRSRSGPEKETDHWAAELTEPLSRMGR